MKYLTKYKIFESQEEDSKIENIEEICDVLENDRIYNEINDICQELKDDGLMIRVQISECVKIGNMLCDEVVTIWTNVISSNVRINRIDEVIEYGKVKETYDRIIDYLSTHGYDNYKLKRFNFGDSSVYLDFDGDENQKSESFKIQFYKSVDHHIIESNDDSDVMARYQIFDTDATISFNFDRMDITDKESIQDLIGVYKKKYNGWAGGPESRSFIEYFNSNYGGNATRKAWCPTINLTIHTVNYGDIIIGFGLKDKKQKLMNWGSLSTNSSPDEGKMPSEQYYNRRVVSEIGKYVRDEIINKNLTIDETIRFLNLNVNHKIEWDWETGEILESKKEVSKLKFNKQPRKKGAKTDVYNVVKNGSAIGQVKWSSRLRGYGFLPTPDCDSEIKEFIKELMRVRREENKK